MKILHLTLKKKWFDMHLSGEKNIDYRDIKPYWTKRLFNKDGSPKDYDVIVMKNGYSKNAPELTAVFLGVYEGVCNIEIAPKEWENKKMYCIRKGYIISTKNIPT